MVELERQRREWEERRREYEEQQRKLYEEQQRIYEEQQQRFAMEQEEMGEEEENWDDEEKFDEDGNPIEEKYDEYGELISDRFDKFGEPLSYDDDAMEAEESEDFCEKGGFADAAKYRTSVETMTPSEVETPVKARAMAAEWDDWGEDDDQEEAMDHQETMGHQEAMDRQDIPQDEAKEEKTPIFSSFLAHSVPLVNFSNISSTANHLHSTYSKPVKEVCESYIMVEEIDAKPMYLSSMVCHTVSWTRDSKESNITSIVHKLVQDELAQSTNNVEVIPQVDGIVDEEGSDEDVEEKEGKSKSEEAKEIIDDEKENLEEPQSKVSCYGISNNSADHEMENDGSNDGAGESGMSTDEEIVLKQPGLVGYADTGDDTDTVNEDADIDSVGGDHSPKINYTDVEEPAVVEKSSLDGITEKPDTAELNEEGNTQVNIDPESEDNCDSSETEEYDEEDKPAESNVIEQQSDSEIEEVEVAEKANSDHENENFGDPSERSESESEASESEDEDEDISNDVPVKQPCILVFDSLGGKKDRQARLCATLRDFLTKEFEEKNPGQTKEFSTRTMPGAAPKVPQQPNLTDCGLFLCHNVETFFKNPVKDYTMPVTSLSSWFPDSESRMKRKDVATIIKKLATQQNQDKLEQLQLPDLVFVEPERATRPTQRFERANSPGSDGDNMDDYNSEDDYGDDDDEQRNSERYSSSPQDKRRVSNRARNENFSTEEDDSEEDGRNDKRSEERRQKRYRSDDSGSDEERKSRHQKRRSERDTSSDSGDDFDSSAVYGQRPASLSSPMKRLPPGISISRTVEESNSRFQQPQTRDTSPGQTDITRRLPPGISISRSTSNLPAEASLPTPIMAPTPITMVRSTNVRDECLEDSNNVTIEDVSDCSDDCEIFDLDEPAYKRTYSANLFPRPTNNSEKEKVADRLSQLPPGVSISRGDTRYVEDISESKYDDEVYEGDMNGSYEEENEDSIDENAEASSDGCEYFLPSMVAHQTIVGSAVDAIAVSMVTHQVSQELDTEITGQNVPQYDGCNDPESDDDNENSESVEVNQDQEYLQENTEEENCIENQSQENSAETIDPVHNSGYSVELPTDDIDNIDNQGLEEGEEIYAAGSAMPENNEGMTSGEEFKDEEFDNGSNLQNAEEIELNTENSEEINFRHYPDNLPTEESVDQIDEELEQGAEDIDDSQDPGEGSDVLHASDPVLGDEDEDTVDGEDEVLDTSGEQINDGTDIDNTEMIEESTEVYDDTDNNQEYGYEDCEDEEMYEEDEYSYEYSQPPIKRAKMSPEAEVVLDSESEDDSPAQAQPVRAQAHHQNMIHNQMQLQQALLAQQQQQRAGYHQQPQSQSSLLAQYQQYSQQYPHQLNQVAGHHNTRKRKLEGQALCIKDDKVYLKPFSQLPPALMGETQSNSRPDKIPNSPKPNPAYTNTNTNPYKPLPTPVQPEVRVHQFSTNNYPKGGALDEQKLGGILQERMRQLPPGLVVQRTAVTEQRRGSVEEDDYQSDEPEEIIDGQEADDDLDVIDEQSNKDFYSEDEESCEEVGVNDREDEQNEDENSKESNGTDDEEAKIGRQEKVSANSRVDLVFEEADVDVQEACEIYDKEEVHLQRSMTIETNTIEATETSEKRGDLIEGKEVVEGEGEGDESQSGNVGEAPAPEAEVVE